MVLEFFRGRGDGQLDVIEGQIAEMLETTRGTFGMAVDALTRRRPPEEIGEPLRKRDKAVNKVERAIRRELIVHAGVRGAQADTPLLLTYMSISKDIERVGDITKDMWELASAGVHLQPDVDHAILGYADTIAAMILETAEVFGQRDADAAVGVLNRGDELKETLHDLMLAHLEGGELPAAAAYPLLYRYLQRITAHLMNVLTAVVMPLDRLDYWDEDKMDRE